MLSLKIKIILIIIIIIILFFISCENTQNLTINKIWTKNFSNQNYFKYFVDYFSNENILPVYKFPKGFHYADKNGKSTFSYISDDGNTKYSVSKSYYVLYNEKYEKGNPLSGKMITLFDTKGNPIKTNISNFPKQKIKYPTNAIITNAYPRLSPNGEIIVLFETSGMSFSMVNKKGEEILPFRTYGPLITSYNFSKNNDFFVIGYINGNIALFDNKGKELFSKKITSGKYNVIKSVFLSDNAEYVGVLAGLYDEEIIILNQKGKVLWSYKTGYNQRKNVAGFFSFDSKIIIIGILHGALFFSNLNKELFLKLSFFSSEKIFSLFSANANQYGFVALSFTTNEKSYVYLIDKNANIVKNWIFDDNYIYTQFSLSGETLILQGNTNLICYDIRLEE